MKATNYEPPTVGGLEPMRSRDYADRVCVLVDERNRTLPRGEVIDGCTIIGGLAPHKPSSTGFVHTSDGREFYAHVFGLRWIKEE